MRLVVIDAKKGAYRVYEGRTLVAEYHASLGLLADAKQVEEIRLATPEAEKK